MIQTLRSSFLASRDAAATAPAAAFSLRRGGDTAAKSKAEAVGGDSACCFSSSAIEITIPVSRSRTSSTRGAALATAEAAAWS